MIPAGELGGDCVEACLGSFAVDALTDTKLAGRASAAKTQKQQGKKIVVKVKVKAKEPLTAKARRSGSPGPWSAARRRPRGSR